MWRDAFLCFLVLLSGCASSSYTPVQGFHTCDRNGDQEERKACLP